MMIVWLLPCTAIPLVIYGTLGLLTGNRQFVKDLFLVYVGLWSVIVLLDWLFWGSSLTQNL